jgi:putative peptidoglycan lipid II flippase
VGVVGQSLGTAVFPTLSGQTARRETDDFRGTFSNALRSTLFLSIPASVGIFLLAAPITTLLFQRGEFGPQSTTETAWALQFYSIGLFAHSGLEIVTRAFYAMHDTKTPVLVGVVAMGLNLALSLALIAPLAQGGLALANSIATILETGTLFLLLRQRLAGMESSRIFVSVARILLASGAMGLALLLITNNLSWLGAVSVTIVAAAVGGIVYFGAAIVLKADEMSFVIDN